MTKLLITSGCSFTETLTGSTKTWPLWLEETTGLTLHNVAMGSQGNGLIARKLIHAVAEKLTTCSADDLLVGVMWSGPDRHDFFSDDPELDLKNNDSQAWVPLPTQVIPHGNKRHKGWVICNHGWSTRSSELFYKNFYSQIGQMVYTLEHILRVQWFLQTMGIKYFMSTYTSEVLPSMLLEDVELRPLWQLIDKSKFLPIPGCYEWCRDNTNIYFRRHDIHPLSEHHELFVKEFLTPHLKSIGLL